jgi:hypothetical protein
VPLTLGQVRRKIAVYSTGRVDQNYRNVLLYGFLHSLLLEKDAWKWVSGIIITSMIVLVTLADKFYVNSNHDMLANVFYIIRNSFMKLKKASV